MSLLARIKKLREENGNISINRLEKEAGLSRGSMAKWDDHAPSYDKLKKVADYFNVSVGYLLGTENTKKAPAADTGDEREGYTDMELLAAFRAADERTRSAIRTLLGIPEKKGD